jgi:ketosteroid isomerase-like protein
MRPSPSGLFHRIAHGGEIEPGLVAHHWLIKGTSEGKAFSFKGASIIRVEGDKIRSDEAYFDRKALEENAGSA